MIAILQPYIPHYREEFFDMLQEQLPMDLYCYEKQAEIGKDHFKVGNTKVISLPAIVKGPFVFYNPFPLLNRKYNVLVLMLNFGHLSTWLILLLRPFIKQKIVLWGHGISVKRYVKEEKKPDFLLRWMIALSDGVWFYTKKELDVWKTFMPKMNGHALNNTISGVEAILDLNIPDKQALRERYGITQQRVLIYCARFNEPGRRVDLLVELIETLSPEAFAFVIIGDGRLKPDFSAYPHVRDFGALYDRKVKDELFSMADIYFQPGWVGLSIVEAMSYGKPIFTFKRSASILQCVEYSYIKHGHNGMVFDSMRDCVDTLSLTTEKEIGRMGENARAYVKQELTMDTMADNAVTAIRHISSPKQVVHEDAK
ncbi:glycosyltransferase [Chitinophaga sancti]|uniref:glycosyltransferase n=1 Tax=Chitinophaga sancti TaxID=1004 RepID=UPI003F79A6DF